MRILKLVIWDLDETIVSGVLAEGDEQIDAVAAHAIAQLRERGIVQALATHNEAEVLRSALAKYEWADWFVQIEANLGSKVRMVQKILGQLSISPLDTAFVDGDPFERDSIAIQVPGICCWSVADLHAYVQGIRHDVTEEGLRRSDMYVAEKSRLKDEEASDNYLAFLRRCDIHITVRPYTLTDAPRVRELLERTHKLNLGVLPLDEAYRRLEQAAAHSVLIAEMRDNYGDMGRCGVLHLNHGGDAAVIQSLAISCRTRARGLALSMLIGLCRHPSISFRELRCRYLPNVWNRPLRMLLMAAGFQRTPVAEELSLTADRLVDTLLPDWIHISFS